MDPAMFEAIHEPGPRQNFIEKTTTEARGDEVARILGGRNPGKSVSLMCRFDILRLLYKIPGSEVPHGYP